MRKKANCSFTQSLSLDEGVKQAPETLSVFKPASVSEVKVIVKSMANKCCDLDPIPTWLAKECLDELAPYVTSLVNNSLDSGKVPSAFKQALVRPLLKKPNLDKDEYKSYRPVSNLSFISKVLERVVSSRLMEHQNLQDLREIYQSAYVPGHSTETALVRIHNDLALAVDNHGAALLVLLDLSAAFDTIDHEVLLGRLQQRYGVEGSALAWLGSYLKERKQCIMIDSARSQDEQLLYGVPQGSVLGPLLFASYVSPLGDIIRSYGLHFHSYADDTQIYVEVDPRNDHSINNAVQQVECCLAHVRMWMSQNYLKLNEDKTEIVFISTKSQISKVSFPSVDVGDVKVKPSSLAKNLGVNFDSVLSMESYVNSVCKSCSYHLYNIARIRGYLDRKTVETVVHALVSSKLDYCNSVLAGVSGKLLKRLQRVQNSAARVVCQVSKRSHITPVLRSLHWLPIKKRIEYKLLLLAHKALHGSAPKYLSCLLVKHDPKRTLRSSSQGFLDIPKTKLKSFGDKAFSANVPKLWNKLPGNLRATTSIEEFKRLLKTHLFGEAYGP